MSDRLWLMHFKAMPTPKPRTPKQKVQKAQTPIKAPVTVIITAAITATITTAIIAITTTTTTATTKKVKGKAKERVLPLERWHKRLSHLNYVNVKQLATHSS